MIIEDGERISKKGEKTKPKYKINPDLDDIVMRPKSWTVIPMSTIAHCDSCKPVHSLAAARDLFRSLNGKESISSNRNLTKENFRWLDPFSTNDFPKDPYNMDHIHMEALLSLFDYLSYLI